MGKHGKKNTNAEASPAYPAPTLGLTTVLFTFGTTKDAAVFLTTKRKLDWHVGTQPWPGAIKALKALEGMKHPELDKPVRPVLNRDGQDRDRADLEFKIE